jgi:hypothetical protein
MHIKKFDKKADERKITNNKDKKARGSRRLQACFTWRQ